MGGFEAPVDELRSAGQAGSLVADGVRAVDLAAAANAIAAALPGSTSQQAAGEAGRSWAAAIAALADGLARQATAVSDSAQAYADAEAQAGASLTGPR